MAANTYIIGLTGNIATGKSTVVAMLKSLGACVIDADKLAHWVMRAGTIAHQRIVERFGADMVGIDGQIDRIKLGSVVFSDPCALCALENIVHPSVVEETLARLAACDQAVAVVEAIKLLEANMHVHCHAVWVVTCSREQQIERLVNSRHLTVAQAELRIDAQPPAVDKIAQANLVIDNSEDLQNTWAQVMDGWNNIPGVRHVSMAKPWGKRARERPGTMNRLEIFIGQHPRLAGWFILSIGMVILLLWAAHDKGLSAGQLGSLLVACIALAGACTWIINWE